MPACIVWVTFTDVVRPPIIQHVNRDTPTTVTFQLTIPLSEENADYFEVSYYNHTGSAFNLVMTSLS